MIIFLLSSNTAWIFNTMFLISYSFTNFACSKCTKILILKPIKHENLTSTKFFMFLFFIFYRKSKKCVRILRNIKKIANGLIKWYTYLPTSSFITLLLWRTAWYTMMICVYRWCLKYRRITSLMDGDRLQLYRHRVDSARFVNRLRVDIIIRTIFLQLL